MFQLSERSFQRLEGVHPDLVQVVIKAIQYTEIDFGVSEGVRNIETQQEYVAKGVSWTLDSYHLIQTLTGKGHAVDLVAYVAGKVCWNMNSYAKVAESMLRASQEFNVPLVWGAVWDRELTELDLRDGLDNDIEAYVARFRERERAKGRPNKRPMLDGPHFQLSERVYKRR